MKTVLLTVIIVITYCSSFSQSLGPQVLNSTGGSYKKGYYAVDWSVGELPIIDELNTSNGSYVITNGYIQTFTDFLSRKDIPNIFAKDEIRILPNPTQGKLEVNFLTHAQGKIKLIMYDAGGIIVYSKEVTVLGNGTFERIDMSHLMNSTYYLSIELKASPGSLDKKGAYKIVKIK